MSRWFEIVWTFAGVEYVLATASSRADAESAFRSGRARVTQLVHGGTLRIDECRRAP